MPILSELYLYPIKSCAGIPLRQATLTAAGLMSDYIYDREWMVVNAQGEFLTQRQHPGMALIKPRMRADTLELRAPGMLPLEIPLDLPDPVEAPTLQVHVWGDTVKAYDCDEITATWFSRYLGLPCRLVRFHPDAKRHADPVWTGDIPAPSLFGDGFPFLVISEESLADLNEKLIAQGRSPLPMNRFRPNMVIRGMGPYEEDHTDTFRLGDAILKPVKPCPRCTIPAVDQDTGKPGPDPLDILRTYRVSAKVNGGIAFGMNTILLEGEGQIIQTGQELNAELAF